MTQRFYCPEPIVGDVATLTGSEARHLAQVMRLRPGDRVTLFDGAGIEFAAEIAETHRNHVRLRVLERREVDREPLVAMVVAAALPKGERLRWMVEKLTELGVIEFVPLLSQRSVVRPEAAIREKLQRTVIEASKQCGRNRLMQIAAPVSWMNWLQDRATGLRYFGDPDAGVGWGSVAAQLSESLQRHDPAGVAFAVGPEGGLTSEERDAALGAGWIGVSLGPRTFRIETAAIAFAAAAVFAVEASTSPK